MKNAFSGAIFKFGGDHLFNWKFGKNADKRIEE